MTMTECPQQHLHPDNKPTGYLEWHAWAETMAADHIQEPCPGGCGKHIWVPATDLCGGCSHPTEHHEGVSAACMLERCTCTTWTAS